MKMEISTEENLNKTKEVDKAYAFSAITKHTSVSGRTISFMAMDHTFQKKEI